ncbi:MAG: thiamine pyrophosphate-dependent enzyme [Elusimicrobia bacterium]|nr:thiamine pyrophosphate-dependent enzyme [Candidatus Obscuribacterium magneticum]
MQKNDYTPDKVDIAWCPGCGNFSILKSLKQALAELDIPPTKTVLVSGIGQAAKLPHYLKVNFFNGLHGRALPPAAAIKLSNTELTVIAESGDGDMYGEGGNHFIHAIRRNPSIVQIVHNNMVYGLTKGQASPTSQLGLKTALQSAGVTTEPLNPIALAVALNASFVARAFSGDVQMTTDILKKAIKHNGYALVDIFQPCVTFNKTNTFKWFKEHTYSLDTSYNPLNREAAFIKALETDKYPLGIIYINPTKPTFEEVISTKRNSSKPLYSERINFKELNNLIQSMTLKR